MTMPRLLLALLAAGLLAACGGDRPEATPQDQNASAPATDPWDGDYLWVEPLAKQADLPDILVWFQPTPDGEGMYALGRDGDIYHYDRRFEDAFAPAGEDEADWRRYEGEITKVTIEETYASGDMGSIGFACDPDWESNRFIYVWWVDKGDDNLFLDRLTWRGTPDEILASKVNVISFSRSDPPAPYHMGGICQFLPDGTLILSPGDAERPELSQDTKNLNGSLLRIRPGKGPEGGYTVPEDNPHVGDPEFRPEICAIGVRAPFRGYLHRGEELIFGDVGSIWEEVNAWRVKTAANFGWGRGTHGITDGPTTDEGITPPVVAWSKSDTLADDDPEYNGETRLSAGVGLVYEPEEGLDRYQGRLTGHLIFFEIMRGWIRSGKWNGIGRPFEHEHIGHQQYISCMMQGKDGYLYVATWGGGPGSRLRRLRSPLDR